MRFYNNTIVVGLLLLFQIYRAEAKKHPDARAKTTAELREAATKARAEYEAGRYNPFGFDRSKKRVPASTERHVIKQGPTPFERDFVTPDPEDKPIQKSYRAREK